MLSNEDKQLSPKSVRSISGVMSKIIPVKEPKYYASRRHDHAEVCPRLEKWMEKANSGGFVPAKRNNKKVLQTAAKSRRYLGMFASSKRKRTPGSLRGSPNRRRLSSKRFRESGKRNGNVSPRKSPRKPIRAKTIFNNIRQKSRNFGIRCKTSVTLWKQWIVNGIKWDKHNPLNFPKLKSKSSVNDIDNITKSKRTKNELDGYSSNSVISDIIEETDEPPDNDRNQDNKNNTATKTPEVSKVKKFFGIFRVNKPKESKLSQSAKRPLSPINKVITSPKLEKLEEVHEEEYDEEEEEIEDDDAGENEEESHNQVHKNYNQVNNEKNIHSHNNHIHNNHRDKTYKDEDKDKNNNHKSHSNHHSSNNQHSNSRNNSAPNDDEDENDDIQEYEEVDDVTISDRDLTSNKNFHPMQKLAQIDTEKIENIDRSPNNLKQTEYDEYYDDDIYYDHHLNGYYRTEADPIGDEILRQKAKNKNGAIHRAFNKLKLFF